MKTKYKVDILGYGGENEHFLKAIAHHNGGKSEISLIDLIGYGNIRSAVYPALKVKVSWSKTEDSTLYVIDNKVHTLTITQIELEELVEDNPDDLKDVL